MPEITYRFHLECPRCGRPGVADQDHRVPPPHLSCGECLFEHVEMVEMKVVKVEELS